MATFWKKHFHEFFDVKKTRKLSALDLELREKTRAAKKNRGHHKFFECWLKESRNIPVTELTKQADLEWRKLSQQEKKGWEEHTLYFDKR